MFGNITRYKSKGSSPIISDVGINLLPTKKTTKLGIIDKPAKKIIDVDEKIPSGGNFALAELSHEEKIEAEKLLVKTVMCGRIRFESIPVPLEAPKLICEECENAICVLRCNACDQVFCSKCADLCHPREDMGAKLHPHEADDLIRPIQVGDTSRIIKDKSFVMPSMDMFEDDLLKVMSLDQPNSLANDCSVLTIAPTKQSYQEPKYQVGEKLLFVDPVTGEEAYGKVLSEWDFRHGDVAPTITRGDNSCVWYTIDMIDLVANVGDINDLAQLILTKPPPPQYPVLEGIEDAPLRHQFYQARDITWQLRDLKKIQEFGPKNHLRSQHDVQLEIDTGPDIADLDLDRRLALITAQARQAAKIKNDFASPEKSYGTNAKPMSPHTKYKPSSSTSLPVIVTKRIGVPAARANKETPVQLQQFTNSITTLSDMRPPPRTPHHPHDSKYGSVVMNNTTASVIDENEADKDDSINYNLANNRQPQRPMTSKYSRVPMASIDRKQVDALDLDAFDKSIEATQRALRVLVLPEHALCRILEKQDLLLQAKVAAVFNVVERIFLKLILRLKVSAFRIWFGNMAFLREQQYHYCARRIQAHFRMWRCRNCISLKYDDWEAELRRRWTALHKQFHYCTMDRAGCCTMDRKMYFETITDVNRYAAFLRKIISKVMKFTDRKRQRLLMIFIRRWRGAVSQFLESDLQCGHFNNHMTDVETANEVSSILQYQSRTIRAHKKLQHTRAHRIDRNDFGYDNVACMPLSLTRISRSQSAPSTNDHNDNESSVDGDDTMSCVSLESAAVVEAGALIGGSLDTVDKIANIISMKTNSLVDVPPYHPRVGISKLPTLPSINIPSTTQARLNQTTERRLNYCGYKAQMSGPTDDSWWVIPNKLCMGKIPCGLGHRKKAALATSCLLLAGVDLFVSLMTEAEEADCERRQGVASIQSGMTASYTGARFAADQLIIDNNEQIEKQQLIAAAIPHFAKVDPRYQQAYQEKVRCKARIRLCNEQINKARGQIERLKPRFEWLRMSLESDSVSTIHDVLPLLWKLEQFIADGRCIYVYSREGHGRVGMISGCLLGRLYSLSPYEAMYRTQACHDSATCEEKRPVPVTCPQLQIQRQMISDVLNLTNRVFEGVNWRSHCDPDTHNDQLHALKRGSSEGIDAPVVISDVLVRTKQSVYYEFDIARDTKVPPPDKSGRGVDVNNDSVPLTDLYDPDIVGQTIDIVRHLPLQRQTPAQRPKLPLLRTVHEAL